MARLSGELGKKANCFFFQTSHQVIAYTSQLRYIEQQLQNDRELSRKFKFFFLLQS